MWHGKDALITQGGAGCGVAWIGGMRRGLVRRGRDALIAIHDMIRQCLTNDSKSLILYIE